MRDNVPGAVHLSHQRKHVYGANRPNAASMHRLDLNERRGLDSQQALLDEKSESLKLGRGRGGLLECNSSPWRAHADPWNGIHASRLNHLPLGLIVSNS